jgi:hypothetical protein
VNAIIQWLAMPVDQQAGRNGQSALKYDAPNAVIVHGRGTAYVGLADDAVAERLLAHPDVEILSAAERKLMEPLPGLPVTWESLENQITSLGKGHRRKSAVGLGDVISALTRRARIPECGGCARRRTGLNRITVWGWWRARKVQVQPEG